MPNRWRAASAQKALLTITLPGADGGTLIGRAEVPLEYVPATPPAPPPPSPAVTRTLFGVRDTRAPDAVKTLFPGVSLTREFVAGVLSTPKSLIPAVERVCRPAWNAGQTPIYSMKLDRDQVAAGKWDAPVADLAAWHATQPAAYLVPWHEPEDDMTAAQYVPYFNRIADRVRSVNTRLPLVYAAMAYQWAPKSGGGSLAGRTDTPAVWAQVDADVLGVDVYSGRSFPLTAILPEHPGFARWLGELAGDRPYMVTERGFEAVPDKYQVRADQIRREGWWLRSDPVGQRCMGYVYWNTAGTESSSSLLLDTQLGVPALRDLVAG